MMIGASILLTFKPLVALFLSTYRQLEFPSRDFDYLASLVTRWSEQAKYSTIANSGFTAFTHIDLTWIDLCNESSLGSFVEHRRIQSIDMPRPKKVVVKKDPKEVRAEVRDYIKNERDTVLKKWMALEEQLFSEDTRKAQFIERRLKYETHTIPENIQKFIGTLKRSVRKTMRDKGTLHQHYQY